MCPSLATLAQCHLPAGRLLLCRLQECGRHCVLPWAAGNWHGWQAAGGVRTQRLHHTGGGGRQAGRVLELGLSLAQAAAPLLRSQSASMALAPSCRMCCLANGTPLPHALCALPCLQANTGMSKKRVSTARAAELIARAAYHRLGAARNPGLGAPAFLPCPACQHCGCQQSFLLLATDPLLICLLLLLPLLQTSAGLPTTRCYYWATSCRHAPPCFAALQWTSLLRPMPAQAMPCTRGADRLPNMHCPAAEPAVPTVCPTPLHPALPAHSCL